MNRNFGVGILVLCFSATSVNVGWATDIVDVAPVVVQPYDMQSLNQQALDLERQNQAQEMTIRQLIEKNDQLTQSNLAKKPDQGLAQINQTMLSYRQALLARERMANSENWWGSSRYGDLVALTEDADAMTVRQDLTGLLAQKYQMLTSLKDEMTALNDKLSHQQEPTNQNQTTLNGFQKVTQQQQDKIQTLIAQLGEMDQKISYLNDELDLREEEIVQLKDKLSMAQSDVSAKDEMIMEQKSRIAMLESQSKAGPTQVSSGGITALSPIIVNPPAQQNPAQPSTLVSSGSIMALAPIVVNPAVQRPQAAQYAGQAAAQVNTNGNQDQVDLLKSELENKITREKQQDTTIQALQNQIAALKQQTQAPQVTPSKDQNNQYSRVQAQLVDLKNKIEEQAADLKTKDESIHQLSQALSAKGASLQSQAKQFKDQNGQYTGMQAQLADLKNKIEKQAADLHAKDGALSWLNQVLSVTRSKATYYQLTAKQDELSIQEVEKEIRHIKEDFAQHFKDYNQFEDSIAALKTQVGQLASQLSQKQVQVSQLQAELDAKNAQQAQAQDQITTMRSDLRSILQAQADREIYHRKTVDDRLVLAKQLIGLQQEESSLLQEKDSLEQDENTFFDRHVTAFEDKIRTLVSQHLLQTSDLKDRMEELSNELSQKEAQVDSLEAEMANKIAQEKSQTVLVTQIHDLNAQLADSENQIAAMNIQVKNGQNAQGEVGALKQQLATQEDRADQLTQELNDKIAESDKMTMIVADYQKKLESKDNAYNQQFGKMLSFKNYQALMENQITTLNGRLQEEQAQVVKVKKEMYDLQASANAQSMDLQAKDLNLAIMQQKMMDDKIREYRAQIRNLSAQLASARRQLAGMPSSDEVEFLRSGLKKATAELAQKDAMLLQTKADAAEYAKEFKEQSSEFQSLKDQLADAQEQLQHKDEDLKYKDMAIARLKYLSKGDLKDLKDQVASLTQQLAMAQKRIMAHVPHGYKLEALEEKLDQAHAQIKDLKKQVDQLESMSSSNVAAAKLRQAVDKVNEQGRIINILVKKLQDYGHNVDLTKDTGTS